MSTIVLFSKSKLSDNSRDLCVSNFDVEIAQDQKGILAWNLINQMLKLHDHIPLHLPPPHAQWMWGGGIDLDDGSIIYWLQSFPCSLILSFSG